MKQITPLLIFIFMTLTTQAQKGILVRIVDENNVINYPGFHKSTTNSSLSINAWSSGHEIIDSYKLTSKDYLQKSKHQKTAAWILFGGGSTLVLAGAISMNGEAWGDAIFGGDNSKINTGSTLFLAGLGCGLGSIPLFIAGARNKRKAEEMSAFFKIENQSKIQKGSFVKSSYPAIGIKFTLR